MFMFVVCTFCFYELKTYRFRLNSGTSKEKFFQVRLIYLCHKYHVVAAQKLLIV